MAIQNAVATETFAEAGGQGITGMLNDLIDAQEGGANPGHTHTLVNGASDVTSSAAELNIMDGATLTVTELNFVDGVTSAIQTQMNLKSPLASPTFTGTVTIPTPFTLGAVSVLPTGTELNFVDGVTSAIQTQIDSKQPVPNRSTVASDATPNPVGSAETNIYTITALGAAAEFAAPSGTPVDGNVLRIRVLDDGTGRALTYNGIYRAIGITLPTTTVASKTLYIGAIYNSADTKWDCVATVEEV